VLALRFSALATAALVLMLMQHQHEKNTKSGRAALVSNPLTVRDMLDRLKL
jgi:hypothetical protein